MAPDTARDRALPDNLGALVDELAERSPDSLAWSFFEQGVEVTFAELRSYVDRAAGALTRLGVDRGAHVAIMSGNSLEFCGCWLALAKLGAVTIAVNVRYTLPELVYVLEDGDVEFLLIDAEHLPLLDAMQEWPEHLSPERVVVFSGEGNGEARSWPQLMADAPGRFESRTPVALDDLVNIQYTSGTTGFPKGCMLAHRFWLHSARLVLDDFDFKPRRVIYNQNFFYMDGPLLATMCMLAGASFFMVTRPSVARFMAWARQYEIDYCFFFEALYKTGEQPDDTDNSFKLLHTFGFNRRNHADLERRYATIAREAYGMTECGAALRVPEHATDKVGSGSCGLPLPTREVAIMGDDGLPVAAGEIGELWLRGPGMMLGYYNKPEASAETLNDGWLRTGDLFRQDPHGYLYIVGRKKDMVRRNAENIACREVEEALRAMPEVREAAVVAVPDDRVGEEVKAYVQLQQGCTPEQVSPQQIVAHCRERLAVFKVPRYIEFRDSFPMTDSARVEKTKVVAGADDLRSNSYDRVDECWR